MWLSWLAIKWISVLAGLFLVLANPVTYFIMLIINFVCVYVYVHIDNGSDDKELKISFSAYDDVSNAFDKLFTICQKATKVSSEEFRTIRNSCVARASEPLRSLIKRATDIHCLYEILADNNKYCNWMNVSFLKVIAIACGNENLQSLIAKGLYKCDLLQTIT